MATDTASRGNLLKPKESQRPKVSVIIPCYNQARFLAEAIESALNQSVPPHEVIVIDDGSSDNTAEVACSYSDVRCVRQQNQGLCVARQTGYDASTGDFLIFLDSDDRLDTRAIENGHDALSSNADAAFAYGRLQRIDLDGGVIGVRGEPERSDFYRELLTDNYIPTPGMVLFRRSCLERYGPFDPSNPATADYDLYLRVAADLPLVSHDNIVVQRRVHPDSMSRNAANMLSSVLKVHRRQWPIARSDDNLRSAYLAGRRFWKEWYGSQLVTQINVNRGRGDWPEFCHGLVTLLRYAPSLISRAIEKPRRSNVLQLVYKDSHTSIPDELVLNAGESKRSGDRGELRLLTLKLKKRDDTNSKAFTGEEHYVASVDCKNARIGTRLMINDVCYDTVFCNAERLVAYIAVKSLSESESCRVQLLG